MQQAKEAVQQVAKDLSGAAAAGGGHTKAALPWIALGHARLTASRD